MLKFYLSFNWFCIVIAKKKTSLIFKIRKSGDIQKYIFTKVRSYTLQFCAREDVTEVSKFPFIKSVKKVMVG